MLGKTVKNYAYNFFYQMIVLLVPIILSPYLARILGANNLGIYSYIYSCVSLISTFCLLGTYSYGSRQIAYSRDSFIKTNSIFWNVFILRLVLGLVGILIYYVIATNTEYEVYFAWYFPWLIASIIDVSWLFIGMEDMRPTAIKNTFIKICSVILIFIFVKKDTDLKKYIFIMSFSTLIANGVLLIQCRKYISKFSVNISLWIDVLKDSIMLFLPQVAVLLYLQVDKIMLKELTFSTSQVAYYDQAEKIVSIPLTFITILSTVIMPKIANYYINNKKDDITQLIIKVSQFSLFVSLPMMFGLICIAQGLIPWYLGDDFIPVSTIIMILAPTVVFNSLLGISGNQYFTATNQLKILLISNVVAAITNICLNAILIPSLLSVGAAIATVLSTTISVLIQYLILSKQMNIRPVLNYIIKYGVISLIMSLIVFFISRKMNISPFATLIEVIAGCIIYFGICFVINDQAMVYVIKMILGVIKKV